MALTNTNAFTGRGEKPADSDLAAALGPAKAAWDQLLANLARDCEATVHELKCYSPKSGWALRAKRKKRTIVWLSPSAGSFTVLFILGAKAMEQVRNTTWPKHVAKAISEASKYPEGTGVRLHVRGLTDIAVVQKLAAIKAAH